MSKEMEKKGAATSLHVTLADTPAVRKYLANHNLKFKLVTKPVPAADLIDLPFLPVTA